MSASNVLTEEDERYLLLVDLKRLLHRMEHYNPDHLTSYTLQGRAVMALDMLEKLQQNGHPVLDDALRERVHQACQKAEDLARKKRETETDWVDEIFFKPNRQGNARISDAIGEFGSERGEFEVESPYQDADATDRLHSSSRSIEASRREDVEELQKAQREQLEAEISHMASQLKASTQRMNSTIRGQTEHLEEMEALATENVHRVGKAADNVQEHNNKAWSSTIATWTLMLTIFGTFLFCMMTIQMAPKRADTSLPCLVNCNQNEMSVHERARVRLDELRIKQEEVEREANRMYELVAQREAEAARVREEDASLLKIEADSRHSMEEVMLREDASSQAEDSQKDSELRHGDEAASLEEEDAACEVAKEAQIREEEATRQVAKEARVREAEAARRAAEAARVREEETARQEAARRAAEEARVREKEAARLAAEEAARQAAEEARVRDEEAARLVDEEARIRDEEEARRAAEEAARHAAEEARIRDEEAARLASEEAARHAAEEARLREEEAARLAAEEAARHAAEEAARHAAEEARLREEEAARLAAEEAARHAAEEARLREEEAARLLAEQAVRRAADEARVRKEEAARLAAEEAARRAAEEARVLEEEADRIAAIEGVRRAAEEARVREEKAAINDVQEHQKLQDRGDDGSDDDEDEDDLEAAKERLRMQAEEARKAIEVKRKAEAAREAEESRLLKEKEQGCDEDKSRPTDETTRQEDDPFQPDGAYECGTDGDNCASTEQGECTAGCAAPAGEVSDVTPLDVHRAAAVNNVDALRRALQIKPEFVTHKDDNGWEPLHEATFRGQFEALQLLLHEYNVDVNTRTKNGATALWWARKLPEDHPVVMTLKAAGGIAMGPVE